LIVEFAIYFDLKESYQKTSALRGQCLIQKLRKIYDYCLKCHFRQYCYCNL